MNKSYLNIAFSHTSKPLSAMLAGTAFVTFVIPSNKNVKMCKNTVNIA